MKKILAAVLALVTVVSFSATAFAAGNSAGMGIGDKTLDVTASYHPSGSGEKVYNVDITWDSMSFNYTETTKSTWNPTTHTYSTPAGSWDKTEADITVTNHSDVGIQVDVTYTAAKADTGITAKITNGSAALKAGEEGKPKEADKMTATLTISGKPNTNVTENGVTIGTVTIRIS